MKTPSAGPSCDASGANPADVATLYDWLSRYVQLVNVLCHGQRFVGASMHKSLNVPTGVASVPPRQAGMEYVNDHALQVAALPPAPRVLDAGCGFGGTMFHWYRRIGGTYDGLTLSRVQQRVAQRQAQRLGLQEVCQFYLRSYEAPLTATYDAVLAIESLLYTTNLQRTVAHLANALRPGGVLIMVEDMASVDVNTEAPADAALLRTHWGCERYPMEHDYRQALAGASVALMHEVNLTAYVRCRARAFLDAQEARYAWWYARLPLTPVRAVLSAYLGGVAIERLYQARYMRYMLLAARRHE
jgi:SAM-dependent methyltransferase